MSGFDFLKKPVNPFIAKARDVQQQTVNANPTELKKALDTLLHLDEPKEVFIGYQDAANYVLLAGPYANASIASFRFLAVWKQFMEDNSLVYSFPLDKRKQELLTTFTLPASAKRKGAYGKL